MIMKRWRWIVMIVVLLVAILAVLWRLFDIHVRHQPFFEKQGKLRSERLVREHAVRGAIVDRDGRPLAMSLPIETIWVNPKVLNVADPRWQQVIAMLRLNNDEVEAELQQRKTSQFMYLKRQISPALAKKVMQLQLHGVYTQQGYRRFYPMGEAAVQLIGLTNVDNRGVAGLEQYYDHWLAGQDGLRYVERDLKGRALTLKTRQDLQAGKPLALSVDRRVQFILYRALKAAVQQHQAAAAAAVIIDVHTGQVLAMASLPSFNPNDRQAYNSAALRNRVITDVFEPGSVFKPLAMAAVMNSGAVPWDTVVDTAPGRWRVGGYLVRDTRNYGDLTLQGVIKKSSNVGISKLVLSLPDTRIFPDMLRRLGFGQRAGIGFPGERTGVLPRRQTWPPFALATLSFGYGVSVTALQLAQAYAVLANHGMKVRPTLLKHVDAPVPQQVMQQDVADKVLHMVRSVTQVGGTGVRAQVHRYQVAGKTGTARKAGKGGYLPDSYTALFVGVVPASQPKWVMVVVVDDPRGEAYYGGTVAAPVFSKVMTQVLHLFHIRPDAVTSGGSA